MDITVRVKPGSRKGASVEPLEDDPAASWVVTVRERAVDGAANAGVERAVAEHFGVPRSAVEIVRGHTARIKRVRIDGI
ncbi:DUF167 domain-containing protein [Agromyces protaetiae]|uniref:DUF167 domain-containing protein n=1 Tax=Agromyces protaetiae TaxID=2509455 RepID=A0A4P6FEM1_9MICO|nr:DUF167 domain-containing protein [Agromyces protaetiae]QAY74266.1 DUF167 domain-containing protein [Agromyces protaetiae]